ncbi:hypothetical protein B0H10DRAFT_2437738, partial [Mycena sp. CBHHK59/15]
MTNQALRTTPKVEEFEDVAPAQLRAETATWAEDDAGDVGDANSEAAFEMAVDSDAAVIYGDDTDDVVMGGQHSRSGSISSGYDLHVPTSSSEHEDDEAVMVSAVQVKVDQSRGSEFVNNQSVVDDSDDEYEQPPPPPPPPRRKISHVQPVVISEDEIKQAPSQKIASTQHIPDGSSRAPKE